jgi:diacylglycerol kinase family enzyme
VGAGINRIELVANTASGSVGPTAPDEARAILDEYGVSANVRILTPGDMTQQLQAALDTRPDLLVVLAGDGTARTAAELCGPTGPLLAPLPGGTMNMLPHALYGQVSWQEALRNALIEGEARTLGGGEVEGRTFLVAAILGSPALWAPAREAARMGQMRLALGRARRAWGRAFSGRLRFSMDGGPRGKAEALTFLCPLTSRAMDDEEQALEAAILDPAGAAEAFRLGVHAMIGDWRNDPKVEATRCRNAQIWAAGRIPAVLDGEPARLNPQTRITWRPAVVQVLAPPKASIMPAKGAVA